MRESHERYVLLVGRQASENVSFDEFVYGGFRASLSRLGRTEPGVSPKGRDAGVSELFGTYKLDSVNSQ